MKDDIYFYETENDLTDFRLNYQVGKIDKENLLFKYSKLTNFPKNILCQRFILEIR
jgi:hypothetical protein